MGHAQVMMMMTTTTMMMMVMMMMMSDDDDDDDDDDEEKLLRALISTFFLSWPILYDEYMTRQDKLSVLHWSCRTRSPSKNMVQTWETAVGVC